MKRVAIIELAGHFEVARAYAKMAIGLGYKVVLITNEKNYNNLKNVFSISDNIVWSVKKNETYDEFIKHAHETIDQCDMAICCTPECQDGTVLKKTWQTRTLLVLHDVNNYFNVKNNLVWQGGFTQWLRILKYFAKGYFAKRKKALKTFDKAIVPSIYIKQYIDTILPDNDIEVLPFLYNEENVKIHDNKICTIVIPGTVSQRSRDYLMTYQVLSKMIESGFDAKLSIVLLGQCLGEEGKKIKKMLSLLESPSISITTFDAAVPQAAYDKIIAEADFFLLPLQSKWQYGIVNEIGSLTCLSGNIGDMVRYGMPVLLPTHYQIQQELLPLVTYFDTEIESAAVLWSDYIKNKTYNEIKAKSLTTMTTFNQWGINVMSPLISCIK